MREKNISEDMARKDNPEFQQVSGYVPMEVARRFKIVCINNGWRQADGLELAIRDWVDRMESRHPVTSDRTTTT